MSQVPATRRSGSCFTPFLEFASHLFESDLGFKVIKGNRSCQGIQERVTDRVNLCVGVSAFKDQLSLVSGGTPVEESVQGFLCKRSAFILGLSKMFLIP